MRDELKNKCYSPTMKTWKNNYLITLTLSCLMGSVTFAQDDDLSGIGDEAVLSTQGADGEVSYPASFFQRYQPSTAFDMVQRVPGFQIDNGGDRRGFGAAAGNILINGRRPSTKDDQPAAILGRIDASHVERIELIRGQLRGIDMRGQSVVANIIIREDTPAITKWKVGLAENLELGLTPETDITYSSRLRDIQYSVGARLFVTSNGDPGPEEIFDGDGNLIEKRFNEKGHGHDGFEGYDALSFVNALTWFGDTLVQLNSKAGVQHRNVKTRLIQDPQPQGSAPRRIDLFNEQRRNHLFELGLDAERFLSTDLLAKGIFLYNYLHQYPDETRRIFNASGVETEYRVSDTEADASEIIGRLELNWAGWENHGVQLNLEGAFNVLDKLLIETTERIGFNPVVQLVPGGNVRVNEERWDLLFKDTWALGVFTLDYGVGVEISNLSTTRDSQQSRSFTFIKPETLLTYSPNRQMQTRLGVRRDVAQLDLNDFVSATVLQDNRLAVGNPDLKPQSTWVIELSNEWRFGELGVVTLTGFYHSITDVIDLLPVEIDGRPDEFFEAVGNIGDGKRWGLRLDNTISMEWLGLKDARVDMQLGWQDSSVTDPVTGNNRVLGSTGYYNPHPPINFENETDFTFIIDYRQDFEASRFSWGWRIEDQGVRPQFKTNELDLRDASLRLHTFIETTRWWDVNIRLSIENILNFSKDRDRTVFTGLRDLSPIDFREVERRRIGTDLMLSVSGSF
jgi:outer membrane receptor protein involved in Fe transport